MKSVIALLLSLAGTLSNLAAQNQIGVFGGVSGNVGDVRSLSDENIGLTDDLQTSFALSYLHEFTPLWAGRGQLSYTNLRGSDADFADLSHRVRNFSFSANVFELSAAVQLRLFRGLRKDSLNKKSIFPYLFTGVGVAFFRRSTDFNENSSAAIDADLSAGNILPTLPAGGGVRWILNNRITLAAEAEFRLPVSDYYDGISAAANPASNDAFASAGLRLSFALNHNDADADGVPDRKDVCPDLPGLPSFDGCPDTDGDGIPDTEDNCPAAPGLLENAGCPDTDADGVIDSADACPDLPGLVRYEGCPDTDADGLPDPRDACPNEPGTAENEGCPDRDNDGIVDKYDECPEEPGVISENGCPLIDRDADGVADAKDACPDEPGVSAFDGCTAPDTDGDGLRDNADKCPNRAGELDNDGCPQPEYLTLLESNTLLSAAGKNVRFASAGSTLTAEARATLDEIYDILQKVPPADILEINGYTDSRGSAILNQRLSERRAKACRDYLIGKGTDPARMTYKGYGEVDPVASNATAEGRAQNRRVIFGVVRE